MPGSNTYGENHEKSVISFKNMGIFGLMVIRMQIPQKTVHYKFVSAPSDAFHKQVGNQKNQKGYHF